MLLTVFNLRYALITWPAILMVRLSPAQEWWLLPVAALCLGSVLVGLYDLRQTRHAVLRNYPVAAHLRFLLEAIRPEMRQYSFEGDKDGTPFPRDKRSIVYQRAKTELDKRPFGTQFNVYQ
jgi:glutamate synthase domain-containing protein 2